MMTGLKLGGTKNKIRVEITWNWPENFRSQAGSVVSAGFLLEKGENTARCQSHTFTSLWLIFPLSEWQFPSCTKTLPWFPRAATQPTQPTPSRLPHLRCAGGPKHSVPCLIRNRGREMAANLFRLHLGWVSISKAWFYNLRKDPSMPYPPLDRSVGLVCRVPSGEQTARTWWRGHCRGSPCRHSLGCECQS